MHAVLYSFICHIFFVHYSRFLHIMQDFLLEIPYRSRTGTGKSFTGVEAIRHLLKVPSSLLDPEPERPHLERPCFMFRSSTWVSLFLGERHENHVYRQFELQQLTWTRSVLVLSIFCVRNL